MEQSRSRKSRKEPEKGGNSIKGIKSGLHLTDEGYKELYALVEEIMVKHGWAGRTFRAIHDKETIHKGLGVLLRSSPDIPKRLRTPLSYLDTPMGRQAFYSLVHKVSSNYRRRKHPPIRESTTAKDTSDSVCYKSPAVTSTPLPAQNTQEAPPDKRTALPDDIWRGMVSITTQDRELKPVCRPCELVPSWPSVTDKSKLGIDDMDYARFVSILQSDHAFNSESDQLGWEKPWSRGRARAITILNARQWKAVIAHILENRQKLNFVVLSRHHDVRNEFMSEH